MNEHEELSPELLNSLRKMQQTREPLSGELEDRVVAKLRRDGLLKRHSTRWVFRTLVACGMAMLFVTGIFVGRSTVTGSRQTEFNYVLLLEEGPSYQRSASAQEAQVRVSEYRQWAINLRQQGVAISGMKLQAEATTLGPRTEDGSQLAGLFSVRASDIDSARRIAGTCPHLRYGGGIVVRPIAKT